MAEHIPKKEDIKKRETFSGEDESHKRAKLVVAVTVTTLFIVAAWIMLLPYQLKEMEFMSEEDKQQWEKVQNETENKEVQLREALNQVHEKYDSLEGRYQEGSKTEPIENSRVPEDVVKKLRDKIQELEAKDSAADIGSVAETAEIEQE